MCAARLQAISCRALRLWLSRLHKPPTFCDWRRNALRQAQHRQDCDLIDVRAAKSIHAQTKNGYAVSSTVVLCPRAVHLESCAVARQTRCVSVMHCLDAKRDKKEIDIHTCRRPFSWAMVCMHPCPPPPTTFSSSSSSLERPHRPATLDISPCSPPLSQSLVVTTSR